MNAGADYTIPRSTPFTLTATGSDADGDFLLYTWEQFDAGAASPPNTDDGTRAIFRSFPPSASPSRTFPKLSDLLGNTTTLGESLPTTTRSMNFRVTVRDNRLGGGGTASDDMIVNVRSDIGPFLVTYPNTAVTVAAGSLQTVTWDPANTWLAPVSAANVKISLSTDGGNTFPIVLAASTPNDGSETITVPAYATTAARVKVEAVGNVFFDVSNANFTINASSSTLSIDDVTVTEGNFGTDTAIFTVRLAAEQASTVTVAYAAANGTATSPSDYRAASGTLTFAPGAVAATVAVTINGDAAGEGDETVLVNLSSPVNATIADGQGVGTIRNDDAAIVTPGIVDGTFEAGSPWPAWTVQSSNVRGTPVCDLATNCSNGTFHPPYAGTRWALFGGGNISATTDSLGQTVMFPFASSLVLSFQMHIASTPSSPEDLTISIDGVPIRIFRSPVLPEPGYSRRQIDLTAYADGGAHALRFSYRNVPPAGENAAFLIDNVELLATPPTLAIGDVAVSEGQSGTTAATFTVTLAPARASTVTVAYATSDRTAAAGSDYVSTSGVLTFAPGQTTQTITVAVNGDATSEPNESFLVNLSAATNAAITNGQGIGTITNDEGAVLTQAIVDGTFRGGLALPRVEPELDRVWHPAVRHRDLRNGWRIRGRQLGVVRRRRRAGAIDDRPGCHASARQQPDAAVSDVHRGRVGAGDRHARGHGGWHPCGDLYRTGCARGGVLTPSGRPHPVRGRCERIHSSSSTTARARPMRTSSSTTSSSCRRPRRRWRSRLTMSWCPRGRGEP